MNFINYPQKTDPFVVADSLKAGERKHIRIQKMLNPPPNYSEDNDFLLDVYRLPDDSVLYWRIIAYDLRSDFIWNISKRDSRLQTWQKYVLNSDLKRHFYRYDGSNKEFAIQDIFYKLPTDNDIHFVMMDCMNLVCLIVQKYGSHSYGSVLSFGYGDRLTQYRVDMDKWYKSNINFSESQIDKLV